MKLNVKFAILGMALGLGIFAANSVQAVSVETTKGARLVAAQPLKTVADFKALQKGDKIAAYCPLMKTTYVTTVRDVDSKGHATITDTGKGLKVGGCSIILEKAASGKEASTKMVCPDGTLRPVQCGKM